MLIYFWHFSCLDHIHIDAINDDFDFDIGSAARQKNCAAICAYVFAHSVRLCEIQYAMCVYVCV